MFYFHIKRNNKSTSKLKEKETKEVWILPQLYIKNNNKMINNLVCFIFKTVSREIDHRNRMTKINGFSHCTSN